MQLHVQYTYTEFCINIVLKCVAWGFGKIYNAVINKVETIAEMYEKHQGSFYKGLNGLIILCSGHSV